MTSRALHNYRVGVGASTIERLATLLDNELNCNEELLHFFFSFSLLLLPCHLSKSYPITTCTI